MTMKVDETGMLHLLKMTLAQKGKFNNFFGAFFFFPLANCS